MIRRNKLIKVWEYKSQDFRNTMKGLMSAFIFLGFKNKKINEKIKREK